MRLDRDTGAGDVVVEPLAHVIEAARADGAVGEHVGQIRLVEPDAVDAAGLVGPAVEDFGFWPQVSTVTSQAAAAATAAGWPGT